MGGEPELAYTSSQLKKLADDLDDMQEYLGRQVTRMDEIVDAIEVGWRGPAAKAYRALHRGAAQDAVRIQRTMRLLALGVRLSEDGFTKQEIESFEQFRRVQTDVDIETEVDALSTPATAPTAPTASAPTGRLRDL
ncbi:WXG100 family type VII secretion target [Streptomyces sp. NPDC006971]|uniref:WXG100 family type VII secretion target n=1 Tax=Streptomyces sp. NPDC006971 TaxID=3154784 RepID=UPI0033CC1B0C